MTGPPIQEHRMLFTVLAGVAAGTLMVLELSARARRRAEFRQWAAGPGRDAWYRLASKGGR